MAEPEGEKSENDVTTTVSNGEPTLSTSQRPSIRDRLRLVTSFDRTNTRLEDQDPATSLAKTVKFLANLLLVSLALAMAIWLVI